MRDAMTKKTARLLCALALAALAHPPALSGGEARLERRLAARVTKVYDGATFQLGGGLRSSLIGVAAPRPGAPGWAQARAFLRRLIENREVALEIDRKPIDDHGQTQYYVFLKDGALVNALVVFRGMGRALVKHPNVRYREELIEAENLAKTYRRGVWGDEFDPRDPIDRFDPRGPADRLWRPFRRY